MTEDASYEYGYNLSSIAPLRLVNGEMIHSIKELGEALAKMPDSVFGYHVSFQRNDFSTWIKDNFDEKNLAEAVDLASDRQSMSDIINKRLLKGDVEPHPFKEKIVMKLRSEDILSEFEEIIEEIKSLLAAGKTDEAEKKYISLAHTASQIFSLKKVPPKKKKLLKFRAEYIGDKIRAAKLRIKKESEKKQGVDDLMAKKNVVGVTKADNEVLKRAREILGKEKSILEKEKVIDFRERKIMEIEERIEKRLEESKIFNEQKKDGFFSKDFLYGIFVGLLFVALLAVTYWKIFL